MSYAISSRYDNPLRIKANKIALAVAGLAKSDLNDDVKGMTADQLVAEYVADVGADSPTDALLSALRRTFDHDGVEIEQNGDVVLANVEMRGYIDDVVHDLVAIAPGVDAGTIFFLDQDASSDEPMDSGRLEMRYDGKAAKAIWHPVYMPAGEASFDFFTGKRIKK